MKSLDVFLPQILKHVPGCPVPVAYDHIRSACITFCERTRMWRYEDTFTGSDINDACPPTGAELIEIEGARFDGMPLERISRQELERRWPQWRDLDAGMPRYILDSNEFDTFLLCPKPSMDAELAITMYLRPREDSEEVPDFLADKFRRVIASGATAEIMMLPDFANPGMAAVHDARFQRELDRLSGFEVRGQTRAAKRTRARFF